MANVKPRWVLTEEEHIQFTEIGNEFWEALGRLTADALRKIPPELRDYLLMFLQDKSSLYGTEYSKYLSEEKP